MWTPQTSALLASSDGKNIPLDEPVFCTFGPAKDQRTDLKRFMPNRMVTSQGIPVLMESLAGNTADVKSIVEGMKKFEENLREEISADSEARKKVYAALTRLPAQLERYSFFETTSERQRQTEIASCQIGLHADKSIGDN